MSKYRLPSQPPAGDLHALRDYYSTKATVYANRASLAAKIAGALACTTIAMQLLRIPTVQAAAADMWTVFAATWGWWIGGLVALVLAYYAARNSTGVHDYPARNPGDDLSEYADVATRNGGVR